MKITISGTPGSGKSVIAKRLAKELGYNYYDVGTIRREIAREHNISLEELNRLGESEDWTDKKADAVAAHIGKTQDNFIFVGRLAYHFIPDSMKIYLQCDLEIGAERIHADKRDTEGYISIEHAVEKLKKRVASDVLRYRKYYGIDHADTSQYDVVIDSSQLSIEEVMQQVRDHVE